MTSPVPAELQLLGLSCILVVTQIVLAAQLGNVQYGLRYAASARDTPVEPPGVLLGLSGVLVVAQIVLYAQLANAQYGLRWAASPRDEAPQPPGVLLGRTRRAFANFLETYPVFVAAVLAVAAVGRLDGLTLVGAHLYLWGRLVYLVLYMTGVPLVRSLFWNVALAGILMILWRLV